MEEPFNKQDEIIEKLLKETPLEQPSLNFSEKVLQQIEEKKASTIYRPLISKTAWTAITAFFIIGLIWVYFNLTPSAIETPFNLSQKINFKNPFEAIAFSKTTVYAIAFMGLFLLQIPFLKRIVEKN